MNPPAQTPLARVVSRFRRNRIGLISLAAIIVLFVVAAVFAVLKRPDEKFVTEAAYDNPKFVEDIVRDLALALDSEKRVVWYEVNSTNYESIHNHNAYAFVTKDKRKTKK